MASSSERPVPRFASFQPKTSTEEKVEKAKASQSSSSSFTTKQRSQSHHRYHRRRSLENRALIGTPKDSTTAQVNEADAENKAHLYVEDYEGDTDNVKYGSIHRYSIPTFRRFGGGNVLGVPNNLKIDRQHGDEKGIVLRNLRNKQPSERSRDILADVVSRKTKLLKIRSNTTGLKQITDLPEFISLENPRKRKRSNDSGNSSTDEDRSYRSIHGKAKPPSEPFDQDLEYASTSDSGRSESRRPVGYDGSLQSISIKLSRVVEEHPQDASAWLDLIGHQDNLLGVDREDERRITHAEKRSTAEIKLHIYEKAIKNCWDSVQDRQTLLLGMMDLGRTIWDTNEQSKRWEQITIDSPDCLPLWVKYVNFRQTSFTAFKYEDIRELYLKRIALLQIRLGRSLPHAERRLLSEHLIYVLLRASLFFHESGYSELAVAMWQALLEFNLFRPDSLRTENVTSPKELFGEFWESEVPRIGEDKSRGWSDYVMSSETYHAPETTADNLAKLEDGRDIFQAWGSAEKAVSVVCRKPARTMDDVAEDDPFRVVLFSDIEPFLVDLTTSLSDLQLLRDAFLFFCGLPPTNAENHETRMWWKDQFIRSQDSSRKTPTAFDFSRTVRGTAGQTMANSNTEESTETGHALNAWLDAQYFAVSTETLFDRKDWFCAFSNWHETREIMCPMAYEWVRNSLKHLTFDSLIYSGSTAPDDPAFAEYYLAFEWFNEPKIIKKTAKSLLKHFPSSVRLYNAYAHIESSRGNSELAKNIISSTLGMRASASEKEQNDYICLWITLTWSLMDQDMIFEALQCLLCIPDGDLANMSTIDVASPTVLLKATDHLTAARDFLFSSGDSSNGILYAQCLLLLTYLSTNNAAGSIGYKQGVIENAINSFDISLALLTERNGNTTYVYQREILCQSSARLLYWHAKHGSFQPRLLRDCLSKYIAEFPSSSMFLSLFAWNEAHLRIEDRMRSLLRSTVLIPRNESLIGWFFAIRHETRVGNVHSVRAAFENAVASPVCAESVSVWKDYVLYCLRTKEYVGQAKQVLYRGMRACPWSKDLLLVAFDNMGEFLTFEELKALHRILAEKELRVHIDIEDQVEELNEG